MLQAKITEIKDYILAQNTYFTNGYDDVFQDYRGVIRDTDKAIFPEDTLGNYFYLRQPDNFTFNNSEIYRISQCQAPLGIKGEIVLVAVVLNGDTDKVFNNLIYTLIKFGSVLITKGVLQPERVVLQELTKMDKEKIKPALARIPNGAAIVSITFNIEEGVYNKCIVDPCKC